MWVWGFVWHRIRAELKPCACVCACPPIPRFAGTSPVNGGRKDQYSPLSGALAGNNNKRRGRRVSAERGNIKRRGRHAVPNGEINKRRGRHAVPNGKQKCGVAGALRVSGEI